MKYFFTLLLSAAAISGWSQDYCKNIKKEVTDNNTNYIYESPYDAENPPAVRVTRSYSTNEEFQYDNFNIVFTIPCEFSDLLGKSKEGNEEEMEEVKIVVEFDDKSKIVDDTLKIVHETKGDGSALRVGYFPVTPQNVKSFTGKKITKFYLAKASADVPADMAIALQQYTACINSAKK